VKKGAGNKGDGDDNVWLTVGRYLALLTTVPAAIFVGYGIGLGLDHLFSTHFLRFVFVVIGTAAGFVPIIWEVSRDE
jgi:F0F1-type ATP synthase assembly protein I